jgi:GNAT acetyltransferase-like protein
VSLEVRSVVDPSAEIVSAISQLAPENPFYTKDYCSFMRLKGMVPVAFQLESSGELVAACTAFSKRGRMNHRLEITSSPDVNGDMAFWNGVRKFCRDSKVSLLDVYTFASPEGAIPQLDGEISRTQRFEFQLDLTVDDLWPGVHRRHIRQIKAARTSGVELRRSSDTDDYRKHADLANLSLSRRRGHGSSIDYEIDVQDLLAFRDLDAGELYFASDGSEMLASMLVLKSAAGAYAQTSGTSDKGRECGASQFLFYEIASALRGEGKSVFNLGGTDVESVGLQEFKFNFGTKKLELEKVQFDFGGVVRKTIGKAVALIRPGR